MIENIKRKKNILVLMTFVGALCALLFNRAIMWEVYQGYIKRIIGFRIIEVGLVFFPPSLVLISDKIYHKMEEAVHRSLLFMANVKKKPVVNCAKIGGYFVLLFLAKMFSVATKTVVSSYSFIFYLSVFWLLYTLFLIRKSIKNKPEWVYFLIIFFMGTMTIHVTPQLTNIIYDDDVHYKNTVGIVSLLTGRMYFADDFTVAYHAEYTVRKVGYTYKERQEIEKYLNGLYDTRKQRIVGEYPRGPQQISHILPAVGIVLGRALHLSYTSIFMMGRMFHLLFYATIIFWAVKKIRYGKNILGCFSIIPTWLYMSSMYNYDPWVVGWILFSYAIFFRELQTPEEKISQEPIVGMIGGMFLAGMVKMVYFTLLFPMLFMPREKFVNKKYRRRYIGFVLMSAVVLVLLYVLPMMLHVERQVGDPRGAAGVSFLGQIDYIVGQPIQAMMILLRYMAEFLSLDNAAPYLNDLYKYGLGNHYVVVLVILMVLTFIDRGEVKEGRTTWIRVATIIGAFGGVFLSVLAMYITFTPVGSKTVDGFQIRYALPVMVPVLLAVGSDRIHMRIRREYITLFPALLLLAVYLNNIWCLCLRIA